MRRCLALALAIVAIVACGKKSAPQPTDSLPYDDLSKGDVDREKKRMSQGETVGELLRAPKVRRRSTRETSRCGASR